MANSNEDKSPEPITTVALVNFGPSGSAMWNFSGSFKGFRLASDGEGHVWAVPVIPFDPIAPADGKIRDHGRSVLVDLFNNSVKIDTESTDGENTTNYVLWVSAHNKLFNGVSWDRQRGPSLTYKGTATGATPQNVTTAVAGLKRRVFKIFASASAAGTLSFGDLTGITSLVTAGGSVNIDLGPQGILQDTANTVITIVSSGGGTITCAMIVSDGE